MRSIATSMHFHGSFPSKLRLLWLLAFLCLTPPLIDAADFSTTGVDRLQPFFAKADSTNRPITILSFGDSMADSYRSLTFVLMNRFVDRLGISGFSLNNYAGGTLAYPTNGSSFVSPDSFWFTTHQQLPPGGSTSWEKLASPGGVYCDRVGVFFVAHPQGGNMQ